MTASERSGRIEIREQEQFLEVVDRDEATRRWWTIINRTELHTEIVPISESLGRVLAQNVISNVDVPGFDRSNVDGFAVISEDTFGVSETEPRLLKLNNEVIHPGIVPAIELQPGTATSIATGGMIPRGADAVIMVEQTRITNDQVAIYRASAPGAMISYAGTDIARGELVLLENTRLTARETGLLAAIGEAHVSVRRRPVVAVISSGNEIIEPGVESAPGMIYDANARLIADAVRESGGLPLYFGIVPDDLSKMQSVIGSAIEKCDLVIVSGGTSKGSGDVSYKAIASLIPGILVHGVALKPGKPVCLGASGNIPIAILPGFPTSAIFTFHEFVAPVIRHLAGNQANDNTPIDARMATRVNSEKGRTEYLLVGLMPGKNGLSAYPMGKGSGSVTTFSRADGFLMIPKNQEYVEENEPVKIIPLGEKLKPADLVIIGSHCLGLDLMAARLAKSGFSCKTLWVGSQGGIDAAIRGECDIAGVHLLDPDSNTYNRPFLTPELKLLFGYGRMQGFVCRKDDTRFQQLHLDEAINKACTAENCRMVSRNRGSGTRIIIDQILGSRKPAGYNVEVRSHHAVAASLSQKRADWGVTIESVARFYDLAFIPIRAEHYDFIVPEDRAERPAVQEFIRILNSPEYQNEIQANFFQIRKETGQWDH